MLLIEAVQSLELINSIFFPLNKRIMAAMIQSLVVILFALIASGKSSYPRPEELPEVQIEEAEIEEADEPRNQFGRDILAAHNEFRSKHNAPPLVWSAKAAHNAEQWANFSAIIRAMLHGNHEGMGQNCAYKYKEPWTGEYATFKWYDEIKDYDFNNQGFHMNTAHFTQVIWKGTKAVGCGMATFRKKSFVVCNYVPPGNVPGQFEENVSRPS